MVDRDTTKSLESVKEMEKTIAVELSQTVNLAQNVDPRQDGTVQLNPSFEGVKVVAATNERHVDDFSLDEVNSLLNEVDETFAGSLHDVEGELQNIEMGQPLESISIGADYLKGDDGKGDAETPTEVEQASAGKKIKSAKHQDDSKPRFWGSLFSAGTSVIVLPFELGKTLFTHALQLKIVPPKEWIKTLPAALKHPLVLRAGHFKILYQSFFSYSRKRYLMVGIFVLLTATLYLIGKDLAHNTTRNIDRDPFLKSFDEVAGSKTEIGTNEPEEAKGAPAPEFVVAFPRLISNLKSTSPRHQPMVALEFYMEMSNRESSVEIKSRETEIRDIMARTLEEMSFDEVDTAPGKEKLKLRLKLSINRILNNGRVMKLFFKSIQVRD